MTAGNFTSSSLGARQCGDDPEPEYDALRCQWSCRLERAGCGHRHTHEELQRVEWSELVAVAVAAIQAAGKPHSDASLPNATNGSDPVGGDASVESI